MEAVRKMNTSENIININLKEYFWSLLEQWKCILIAVLVFAMLVPAALAFKNYKEDLDAKNDRDSLSAMSYEDLLNTLNEGDREEVLNAAYQAKLIRDQEEYIHKENVRVYRNVQASIVDELKLQTEALGVQNKALEKKISGLKGVTVTALIFSGIGMLGVIAMILMNVLNITF